MKTLRLLLAAALLSPLPAAAQVEVVPRLTVAPAPSLSVAAFSAASVGASPSLLAPTVLSAPALVAPALLPASAVPAIAAFTPVKPLSAPAASPAPVKPVFAAKSPASVIGTLARSVSLGVAKTVGALFDGGAAREDEAPAFARGVIASPLSGHDLAPGVRLDKKPRRTDAGSVRVNDFHLSPDHALANGAAPITLDAKATDAAAVEKALRALVDANPEKYGAPSSDMAKVRVQLVPGVKSQGQADVYYAVFRQWKKGVQKDGTPYYLLVDGGSLTFVLKVLEGGKPTVMATEGRLYPGVSSEVMTVGFTDEEMLAIASRRLESPPDAQPGLLKKLLDRIRAGLRKTKDAAEPPVFLTREIVNVNGVWRALNLYQASDLKGRPVIVAVDVKSGDAFAWGSERLLKDGGPATAGVVFARGTSLTPSGGDHGPTAPLPLPYANVYDAQGRVVATTAADGTFTAPAGATKLTIRLEGAYAKQSDDDAKQNGATEVTVSVVPGQTVRATLNPDGDSPELAADVNGYVYYSKQVAWLKDAAGIDDERILAPLGGGVKSNRHDMPGNAYYSPADDSLNLQAAATVAVKDAQGKPRKISLENTAQPSIIYHESTHRAVQILSQIALTAEQAASEAYRFVARVMEPVMDGGVNEAIADTVSMFMRGSPLIGEGFYADAPAGPKNLIRTGENTTKFDPKDPDPHGQGEAFMGFTWTLYRALVDALGPEAGAAYAALLMVPTTLYSQPQDVPTAMLHVLIANMTVDGRLPQEAVIRAAAKAHGVTLPAVKP